jgi:hypothetical protein
MMPHVEGDVLSTLSARRRHAAAVLTAAFY